MITKLLPNERLDDLQIKGYEIIQSPGRFCFGMDAVLLSAFARVKKNEKALDLGTGTGILPILLEAKYPGLHYTGLEIQEESADMARRSVSYNGLEERIDIVTGDIKEAASIFGAASFGVITTNPPYMIGDHGLKNQNETLYIARHEALCTLDDILRESAKILKVKGRFYMVHRPFRLPEIMTKMCAYGIEPKRMRQSEDAGRTAVGCISERWKLYGGTACTLRNESVVSKENITAQKPWQQMDRADRYRAGTKHKMEEYEMAGTLYLCATPIGNLEDMTFRAVRILKEVDLIAAEDTRNSIKLLNHFEIKTPMTSYHEYNKIEKGHKLVERLQGGEDIAVITDAGMPGISDPGEELVKMCQEAGITVTAVPGACACVTALTISGLGTRRFAFEAFLPTDKKERQAVLEELKDETRTMVIYEAPHRLVRTLKTLQETLGNRRISICRELTKKHETVFATTIEDALVYYDVQEPKGECVMVIEGKSREEIRNEEKARWEEMSIEEHMELYLGQGMDKKSAMKQVAKDRGVGKRDIYQALL